jgi:two-component system, NarL family, sensor kinase
MKTIFSFLAVIVLCSMSAVAQQVRVDSIRGLLNSGNENDSITVDRLIQLGHQYTDMKKTDSAVFFSEKAIDLCRQKGSTHYLSSICAQAGNIYEINGKYDKAAEYYLESLQLAESINDESLESSALINLGVMNFNLRKGDKALEFYQKALDLSQKSGDTVNMIRAINNIGNVYLTLNLDFKKAEGYFVTIVKLARKINFQNAIFAGLNNLTQIYANTGQYGKAIQTCNEILKTEPNHRFALYNMGSIFYLQHQPEKAIYYMKEALKNSESEPELKQILLNNIAEIYQEIGDFKNSLEYYKNYTSLKDSVHQVQSEKNIVELEEKYQTEKKQKEILLLSEQKRLRNIYIYALIAILLITSLISVFIYRNTRNKRIIAEKTAELQQQKISELEKERQLIAIKSVLKGEDSERTRISRDLHDGLGGHLSIVKQTLTGMKDFYRISQDNAERFDHALNLLDNSIHELRRISRNMMPEALVEFGLKDALQDLSVMAGKDKEISISFSFFGENKRLDSSLETSIYRIAMELVNNALKHARAQEIIIHLVQETNRVYLSVQDNGKGFIPDETDTSKTSGLKNIRARVQSFNGRLDIDSKPGRGTEIGVEFTIPG